MRDGGTDEKQGLPPFWVGCFRIVNIDLTFPPDLPIRRVISPMSAQIKHAFRGWTPVDFLLLSGSILTVVVGFVLAGH